MSYSNTSAQSGIVTRLLALILALKKCFKISNSTPSGTKGLSSKVLMQALVLEPILTPSGLLEGTDDTPNITAVDLDLTWLENQLLNREEYPIDWNDLDFDLELEDSAGLTTIAEVSFQELSEVVPEAVEEIDFIAEFDAIDAQAIDFYSVVNESPGFEFEYGTFIVDQTGEVSFDFLFDGGKYKGELAVFSLSGMEHLHPDSEEFIRIAAERSLSGTPDGYVVISDRSEGARFSGILGPSERQDWNSGDYLGAKTFQMRPGDEFGVMLVPNGRLEEVLENPAIGGAKRPLFSMAVANPGNGIQIGQIADLNGQGNTFAMEDIRIDSNPDRDYNDLIFQVRGAVGKAVLIDQVIDPSQSWLDSDLGQAIISYALPAPSLDAPKFEFPQADQPLIGIIDTGVNVANPDLNILQIFSGRDWVNGDESSFIIADPENEHGTAIAGIIGATQGNGIGIDGINDTAPLWVGQAVGSGNWHQSLREFVDTAKEIGQPNAIANLSLDLTQLNPDGTITTRYELTPVERDVIEYARQNNVLLVVAAGNDGGVMSALGQASQEFDNILTVGAANGLTRADYSSYGYGLDILAPGGTSTNPTLTLMGDGVGTMAGTSIATAHVTGAASQVWAANPQLNYRQVIEILKTTATDLQQPGWDLETGGGLLNMVAAVQLAKVTTPQAYDPLKILPLPAWSGEGVAMPLERATATDVIYRNSLNFVLRWEGGYSNHLNDPGGATNKGVTQNTLSSDRTSKGLQPLYVHWITQAEVEDIYFNRYWKASGSDQLPAKLAMVHFDTAVNMGVGGASSLLQQARQAAPSDETSLVQKYLELREARYRQIVTNNPSMGVFLNGWLNRLNDLRREVAAVTNVGATPSTLPVGRRPYAVRPGDTLWSIAQRELNHGDRWREIQKTDGSSFTDLEARRLLVGQVVYLPVHYQAGTGHPVTTPPSPNPTPIDSRIGQGSRAPNLFQQAYLRVNGRERGLVATNDAYRWGNGWTQDFQDRNGGRLKIMLEDGANTAYVMQYGNLAEYEFMGGPIGRELDGRQVFLGYPRSDENPIPRADGQWAVWQAFAAVEGSARIHYLEGIGSVATWGAIGALYTSLNGAYHWLGMPTRREYIDGDTIFADFQGGRIAFNHLDGRNEVLRPNQQPTWRQITQMGRVNHLVGNIPLNFRNEPMVNTHNRIGTLSVGTTFQIIRPVAGGSYNPGTGNRNDWYEVQVGNLRGFVAAYYVDLINQNPNQPNPGVPHSGQRILDAVNRVNPNQPYYLPHDITGDGRNETFCNWFVADVLEVLGVPILRHNQAMYPPVFGRTRRDKPVSAEHLYTFFQQGGGGRWKPLSATDAVAQANNGQVVVASSYGHIAIVIPGGSGADVRIAQAGAVNGTNMSVREGFGLQTPRYFVYT